MTAALIEADAAKPPTRRLSLTSSDTLGDLFTALSAAQREMRTAPRDSDNPFFKSKYADLASVWEACREALTKHKLCVLQPCTAEEAKVTVTTIIGCSSGEWLSESLTVTAKDGSPQAVGSAITYARRYGLSAMVGVAPDDDDGEAAQPRATNAQPAARPAPSSQPASQPVANGTPRNGAPVPQPGQPVQPKPVAERIHGWARKLEAQGLVTAEHVVGWITLKLGQLEKAAPDDAKAACEEYKRRLDAGEFNQPEEVSQDAQEFEV